MLEHANYHRLWQAVAREFGAKESTGIGLNQQISLSKPLQIGNNEVEIVGSLVVSQPFNQAGHMWPPILQFRPDKLSDPGALPNEPAIHYEWVVRNREQSLDVCLHFQYHQGAENGNWMERVPIPEDYDDGDAWVECEEEDFHNGWTGYRFRLKYSDAFAPLELAPLAANVMEYMVSKTWECLMINSEI